ncbi:MAG: hypothetical protein JXA96_14145 [Sedimentisphaerales bacterium]|nr:hypothetical protein [Sedimentisphaerales bacterium]
MIGKDSNHCQVVSESITGKRNVDDYTFASIDVLSERLGRIKKFDGAFAGISFSPEVQKLQRRVMAMS